MCAARRLHAALTVCAVIGGGRDVSAKDLLCRLPVSSLLWGPTRLLRRPLVAHWRLPRLRSCGVWLGAMRGGAPLFAAGRSLPASDGLRRSPKPALIRACRGRGAGFFPFSPPTQRLNLTRPARWLTAPSASSAAETRTASPGRRRRPRWPRSCRFCRRPKGRAAKSTRHAARSRTVLLLVGRRKGGDACRCPVRPSSFCPSSFRPAAL